MNFTFSSLIRVMAVVAGFVLAPIALRAQTQTITPTAGTVGVVYSYQIVVTGGATPPYVFSAPDLSLIGLAVNASTGLISGTPTVAGSRTIAGSLTANGNTTPFNLAITINPPAGAPVISSTLTASATVGTSFSYSITASPTAVSFNVGGTLPPGVTATTTVGATGVLSGTPTTVGTYNVTLSANNASGTGVARTLVITVSPPAGVPVISSANKVSFPTAAVDYQVVATNSPTSYSADNLPSGVTINSTGRISGTAAQLGTRAVLVHATNAAGTGDLSLQLAIAVPQITSTTSLTGIVGVPFSYQIATNPSATSYNNLDPISVPGGLTISTSTGLISGTPTTAGTSQFRVSAVNANGVGSDVTLTLTITVVPAPVITSATTASGTVGNPFSYTIVATNNPTSYGATALPVGLTLNTTTGVISGIPSVAAVTSVPISASNVGGAGTATLTVTISPAPPPPAGGGGTIGGGGGGGILPAAPTITTHPASQSVVVGSSVTFSVVATSSGLNYQWQKDSTDIPGASSTTLTLTSVTAASAGSYRVLVFNTGGFAFSNAATLTVTAAPVVAVAPTILTQPVSQSASFGVNVSFTVAAAGSTPLTYQWRKDSTAIAGATGATLTLNNVTSVAAGSYSVVISNSAGSVTSDNAVLTVTSRPIAGTYFGTLGNNEGIFALLVRSDRTGVFLGYASTTRVALISRNVLIDANGRFSVAQATTAGVFSQSASGPAVAAAEGEYHIDGVISLDGVLSGSVAELNLSFGAASATSAGATASVAGFYQSGGVGKSSTSYAIVGPAGEALIVTVAGTTVDAGRGTVSADGSLNITTASNAVVTGTVQADSGTLSATVTPPTGAATTFIGLNEETRTDIEKLINISTRSQTGTATNTLIAGFVISGDQKKTVLVRGIGPTLGSAFNVGGSLSAARLEIFRGSTSLAVGTDWGAQANASTIAAAAVRVGAFALANNSHDAALLIDLDPGAYSAVVTGQGGVSGVSLVEVYDATNGPIPRNQRIINIATRATAGVGDSSLIAGFVISGSVPKRVLIRGVGPTLSSFNVAGVLARPQLSVNSGATVLAQNAGWSTSPDAAAIAAGAAQAGAFALGAASQDAALIIYLSPGAYTAQVSGVGNTTGVALIEVYELP